MKAITPKEACEAKAKSLPEFVIKAFNNLLVRKYNQSAIYITQTEVVDEILKLSCDDNLTRQDVFDNRWLDIEPLYREYGWVVNFDKPGYNESGVAMFTFKPKKE